MIKAQTLKGFRDFLPIEAKKRQYVTNTLKEVFELYGFEPVETPALEYEEVLTEKYGDEGEKLMYKFEDLGKRKVALRYDQTVPLARVAAQYQNDLVFPFKRYQMQNVWRAENTQKGRFREFLQVDADIIGSSSPLSDAEIIAVTVTSLNKLGFKNYKVYINDRKSFSYLSTYLSLEPEKIPFILRAIDKIMKIGKAGVIQEIITAGYKEDEAQRIMETIKELKPSEYVNEVFKTLDFFNISKDNYVFDPFMVRGLDYYTGLIFEVDIEGYKAGSVAGGGRYDDLIGIFANKSIPAVGISFGFDRLIEAMEEAGLFPAELSASKVLVAIADSSQKEKAVEIVNKLREKNISAEMFLGEVTEKNLLEKQLKYADRKRIANVLIIEGKGLILRDMLKREQASITFQNILKKLE